MTAAHSTTITTTLRCTEVSAVSSSCCSSSPPPPLLLFHTVSSSLSIHIAPFSSDFSGKKSDFDGHAKVTHDSIHAYSNVYGSKCVGIMNLPHASPNSYFAEGYFNNKCVLSSSGDAYLDLGSPCAVDSTLANRMLLGNNSIFAPSATVGVSCGKSYTFAEWQATGADPGTTVSDLPPAATIIAWARDMLGIPART